MFRIIDLDKAEVVPMENGRGETALLVDARLTDKIDLHLNRLVAGEPGGRFHKHSNSDNVYIVKSGEGVLRVEDETHVIRAGQIVFIPAGARHSLTNRSAAPFEIFEIYTPAGPAFDFVVEEA